MHRPMSRAMGDGNTHIMASESAAKAWYSNRGARSFTVMTMGGTLS
jgi:hypothetical protein